MPAATPHSIQRLLRRCLEKDPKRRLKDIGDARLDIEDALATRNDGTARTTVGGWGVRLTAAGYFWLWLFAAAMGLGTALFVLWPRSEQRVASTALRRVSAELGTDASLVTLQFGQGAAAVLRQMVDILAFVAQASDGAVRQLYVRRLDGLQATPVNGTEGALNPFFSPDSRWIAYFADGKLKKVPVTGGGPVTICTVLNNRGGAWGEDGMITFSPDRQGAGLWQVSSSGGEAKPLTTLQEGETTQRWPQMLRRGTAVLFTGNDRPDGFDGANVVVQVLPQGPRKVLVRGAYYGRYLRSGHLVYVNNGTLFAAPFDLDTLELTGPAVPALDGATVNLPVGAADIAISDNGTVAYLPASGPVNYMDAPIEWMGRDGKTTPLRATPARWLHPRFAADGSRLAFALFDGVQQDVVIYDWSTDALTRLTIDPAGDLSPVWAPDGRRIAFSSTRRGRMNNIFWQRVDRTEEAQRLTESERSQTPESWHPDGRTLALSELDPKTATPSVMMLRLEGDEAAGWRPTPPTLFLEGATSARFSPDGQWLAYVLRASAAQGAEVYVRAFQGQGGPWQVSTGGGNSPVWSSTRPELFYAAPDHRLMVATYSAKSGSFHVNKPRALTESRFAPRPVGAHFDLHPDGARFALAKSSEPETDAKRDHLTIVFDFFDELRRIAPPSN